MLLLQTHLDGSNMSNFTNCNANWLKGIMLTFFNVYAWHFRSLKYQCQPEKNNLITSLSWPNLNSFCLRCLYQDPKNNEYCIVASRSTCYYSENQKFAFLKSLLLTCHIFFRNKTFQDRKLKLSASYWFKISWILTKFQLIRTTVRPRDTRPQAARTLTVHVFE